MKITFRGWQREVTTHNHKVAPVEYKSFKYQAQQIDQPMTWSGPLRALGKLNNLGLSGNFLVEFNFEPEELKSWLEQYAKANPEEALRLISAVQTEAYIQLAKSADSAPQPPSSAPTNSPQN